MCLARIFAFFCFSCKISFWVSAMQIQKKVDYFLKLSQILGIRGSYLPEIPIPCTQPRYIKTHATYGGVDHACHSSVQFHQLMSQPCSLCFFINILLFFNRRFQVSVVGMLRSRLEFLKWDLAYMLGFGFGFLSHFFVACTMRVSLMFVYQKFTRCLKLVLQSTNPPQ